MCDQKSLHRGPHVAYRRNAVARTVTFPHLQKRRHAWDTEGRRRKPGDGRAQVTPGPAGGRGGDGGVSRGWRRCPGVSPGSWSTCPGHTASLTGGSSGAPGPDPPSVSHMHFKGGQHCPRKRKHSHVECAFKSTRYPHLSKSKCSNVRPTFPRRPPKHLSIFQT